MRFLAVIILAVSLTGCRNNPVPQPETKLQPASTAAAAPAEPAASGGAPPDTILIQSPYGNVTFTHKKHYERVNSDCSTCHPKIFQQALAPLNYKKAQHRAAEASMTSCAYCHSIGNSAFAADSNCTKCHAAREH
jgi:c(7)-type cytochrome triheme protein